MSDALVPVGSPLRQIEVGPDFVLPGAPMTAADHCIRAARYGCGCKHCIAWRAALNRDRKDRANGR